MLLPSTLFVGEANRFPSNAAARDRQAGTMATPRCLPVFPVTIARASSSSPAFPDARRQPMTAYGTRGPNGSLRSEACELPHGSSAGRQ
jgi:hypothetical protein